MLSQAFFQSISQQQLYRLSTGSNELQSSAVGNFRFTTTDYCTVELAPTTAKLTVLFRSQIKGREVTFHKTRHDYCYSQSLQSKNTKVAIWYWFRLSAAMLKQACDQKR